MNFSVGLQNGNDAFLEKIIAHRSRVHEVYFSFGDIPNGRSSQLLSETRSPWEMQAWQLGALGRLHEAGISLNLLFNANCYGKDSQSRAFFHKIGDVIDFVSSHFGLASVTTTSPLIAKFVKSNFEGMEVRASVNMEIGTPEGMEYLAEWFDGYYMKREYNRDFATVERLWKWSVDNGKRLYFLANSGCLNFCSAHVFHDNLVAHEGEIAQMDNAYQFTGVCREFLKNESNYPRLYERTNFVRPEDIPLYEKYFVAAKLATRVHRSPSAVLDSYVRGKYAGDLLRLLEPEHSIYPYVLENGDPVRLVKIDGYGG